MYRFSIIHFLLLSASLYANSCPKYYPMPTQNYLSIIIPIYNKNITAPDLDCDEIIDSIDPDMDGDGVSNIYDAFPRNAFESVDSDGDGIGDNTDIYDNRLDNNKLRVYEDADKKRGGWTSVIGAPKRKFLKSRATGTIEIKDNVLYKLKLNDSKHNVIQWDMRANKIFSIYVKLKVKTKENGKSIITNRIMHYYPKGRTEGLSGTGYIHVSIGTLKVDTWKTIRRDLIKDLHDYDFNSVLLSVEEFWIRGKSYLDNIEMLNYRIYEDGTASNNWHIFGNSKNASCSSVYDKYRRSMVIKLKGEGIKTGYALKSFYNTQINKTIQWSMKYNEDFAIYIKVKTRDGTRYLTYKNQDYDKVSNGNPNYLYFGIGKSIVKNGWQTITRNLNKDLRKLEGNNHIINVIGFAIRGSGFISDISLLRSKKPEDDPKYSHKHYMMNVSGIATEVDSNIWDIYVNTLSERHHAEETAEDGIVLNYKKMNDARWNQEILMRGGIGIHLTDPNISKHPYESSKIILRYNQRDVLGKSIYAFPHVTIVDLKNRALSKSLSLKNIPLNISLTGNTLFTPTGKLLLSGYGGDNEVKIFRSIESFDDDRLEYEMEEIASFKKKREIFIEPVLSYAFNKLVLAIRKDIVWFNDRDGQAELYNNTKGELRFIDDLEGGNINTIWHKKRLDVEIHGMSMPGYQGNHFFMIASDGGNRQKIITINSSDSTLNSFIYNKNAFFIEHKRAGGYPAYINNENETFVLYWEETSDPRKSKIVIKKTR